MMSYVVLLVSYSQGPCIAVMNGQKVELNQQKVIGKKRVSQTRLGCTMAIHRAMQQLQGKKSQEFTACGNSW